MGGTMQGFLFDIGRLVLGLWALWLLSKGIIGVIENVEKMAHSMRGIFTELVHLNSHLDRLTLPDPLRIEFNNTTQHRPDFNDEFVTAQRERMKEKAARNEEKHLRRDDK